MKTFFLFLLPVFFVFAAQTIVGQDIAMVTVGFADGSAYFGKKLAITENSINVEFLHSHSVYEFDKNGTILSSTGGYKVGDKVNMIDVMYYKESYFNERSLTIPQTGSVNMGVVFADGQVYFGILEQVAGNQFTIYFAHTGSKYEMINKDGKWMVNWTDKGTYPLGYQLLDIFELDEPEVFYFGS